jgi:hypothetical protein
MSTIWRCGVDSLLKLVLVGHLGRLGACSRHGVYVKARAADHSLKKIHQRRHHLKRKETVAGIANI